mgnify:FL=1
MFKDIIMGITCILLGGFTFSFWCFAMFSGSDWGEFAREMLDGGFNLGRNTIAVIEPAVGVFSCQLGVEWSWIPPLRVEECCGTFVCLWPECHWWWGCWV